MAADYEKIRDENVARYGWDTVVLDLLGRLYSERTHFIFELIQNAEDAGATELTFELFGSPGGEPRWPALHGSRRSWRLRGRQEREVRNTNQLGYVLITDAFARHERGLDGFDPGAQIDGLTSRCATRAMPDPNTSGTLCSPRNRHLVAGVVEKSVRQEFKDSSRENITSAIGMAAAGAAWLPGPDGAFHRPAELSLDDLPPTYKRDEVLAKALRIIQPVVAEASRQLGLPPEIRWGLSAYPDLVATIERELKARAAAGRNPGADEDDHDGGLAAGSS